MFITNEPALMINKTLVIADLHIGITRELYESGVSLPSQVKNMVDRIHKIKKMTGADELVILGDLKHKVPDTSWQELREIPEFLSSLEFKKIIIIKGNHDGNIEKMIPGNIKNRVKVRKSLSFNDYLLSHGHRKANTRKNIVIAHNHPHIRFRDKLGALYTEPCWVIEKMKIKDKISQKSVDLIIMPAFNELCGATIVNRDKLLGPIAKKIINPKVHLLDGTDLGELKALKIKE